MTTTQQKIIAHLENGPLFLRELAQIFSVSDLNMRAELWELWEKKAVTSTPDGKYALRKEVVG